jgi:transcriptional regulator with GAF, ATPase, and Fis domain
MARSAKQTPAGLTEAVENVERQLIIQALQQTTTLRQAARRLKLHPATLSYRMNRLGIKRTVRVTRTVEITTEPR